MIENPSFQLHARDRKLPFKSHARERQRDLPFKLHARERERERERKSFVEITCKRERELLS